MKDANNTTAGTLLAAPSDANHLVYGSFYYKGRIYDADFKTGNLRVWNKNTNLWYTTPDCTGTVYAQQGGPQMVLANVTQPGKLWEYIGEDEALLPLHRGERRLPDHDDQHDRGARSSLSPPPRCRPRCRARCASSPSADPFPRMTSASLLARRTSLECGARDTPGRIRTCDLSLRRRALYPLSYGRLATSAA